MTSIFLPSSASTQISYAVKFNMADKVHRLSLAASANLDNVLKQLTAIFRRLNSGEDALSELQVLKEHCGRVLAEERKRVSNSANREKVRSCEFSKLQFPISQKYRSGRCEPVR